MKNVFRLGSIAAVLAVAGTACALPPPTHYAVDPVANFGAHVGRHGVVVDRMNDGNQALLVPESTGLFSRQSLFRLQENDRDVAAVWRDGAKMVVRTAATPSAPEIGDVQADWSRDDALRLTFRTRNGEVYRTSAFRRTEGGAYPAMLGQAAYSTVEIPGVYFAEVRDSSGQAVGWIKVMTRYFGPPRRVFEAYLPPAINGPLAVAAVKRVDSEINRMERHALNPWTNS